MIKWLKKLFKVYHKCPNNGCIHNGKNHYCNRNGDCKYQNRNKLR